MTYAGAENATPENVRRYLADNYGHTGGGSLSSEDLDNLMARHDDVVQRGVRAGSFASYVGDQIVEAAELAYTDDGADQDS